MRWTSGQNLCLVLTEKRNKSFSGHFLKYWADIIKTSYELAKEADRRWFKTIVLKKIAKMLNVVVVKKYWNE